VGWVTLFGGLLDRGGPYGATVAFVLGGLAMLVIALCYAEVCSMLPATGGEIVYLNEAFGTGAAFAAGWMLALFNVSVAIFLSVSIGWLVTEIAPLLAGPTLYTVAGAEIRLGEVAVGVFGALLIAGVNLRGTRWAASLQDWMTYGLLALIVVLIVGACALGSSANVETWRVTGKERDAFAGFIGVLVVTPFFLAGFNTIPQGAGERSLDASPGGVGRAILVSILAATAFYCMIVVALAFAAPRDAVLGDELPTARAFAIAFDSPAIAVVVLLAGLFGLLTTWNAVLFGAARVLYTLGNAGIAAERFGRLDRHGAPRLAIVLITLLTVAGVFLGRPLIMLPVNVAGLCVLVVYAMTAAVFLKLRFMRPDSPRPYRAPGGVATGVAAMLIALVLIAISLRQHLSDAGGRFPLEWLGTAAWAMVGLFAWRASRATRAGVDAEARRRRLADAAVAIVTCVLFGAARPALAEPLPIADIVDEGEIGRTIERLYGPLARAGGPGAMVAVIRRGELLHRKGYGYANREFQAPWTSTTPYTFYSTTKPMVAVALLRLADEGRIDLDAPVRRYLPEFPHFPVEPTVRQMLQHTSGVWQDERLHYLVGAGAAYEELTLDELYAMVIRQPALSFAPGSAQHYNDAAMRIAGRLLARVLDTSFDGAMRRMVFEPANMRTAAHRVLSNTYRPGQASAYLLGATPDADVARDELIVPFLAVETAGDGGVAGSIEDLIAFARFFSAARPGGSYLERLAKPVSYGPGVAGSYRTAWIVESHRGIEVHSHGGLFGKVFAYVPELDTWILIMANAVGGPLDPDARGRVHFEIVDAVLRAQGGYEERFGAEAESRLGIWGQPPRQDFSTTERELLTGTFLDPISRGVLQISDDGEQLRHSYLCGEPGFLVRDRQGYASWTHGGGERLRLRATDGRLEAHIADWGGYRRLERVEAGFAPTAADLQAIGGTYFSPTYGSIYHVDAAGANLTLRVGAGARASDVYKLEPLAPGVYQATQQGEVRVLGRTTLQISVGPERGSVRWLALDAENLRGFRIDRIDP
jgi:CubicO group peptidase (beta-lactamase class C family)